MRSREQELLDRYKSFSDLDLAAFASNGPGAGKPADDLAKLESYLSSTTEAICKQHQRASAVIPTAIY